MEEDSTYEASSIMQSQNLQASQISHLTTNKSKFVYRDANELPGNMLGHLDDQQDPEIESDSSSEELDEEKAMNDLMKLDNGKEFMSFVKSRASGLLKS